MSIIIGADLVPTKSNIDLFADGNIMELIGERLKHVLDNATYRIFNLETPLADNPSPIQKQGPNLITPTRCVAGFKEMGVNLLTLANNHIMDQDIAGLNSTIKILQNAGISYTGIGENIESASEPFYFTFKNIKIGVYACAEHEFSIADEERPGANPFDPLETPDHIQHLKDQCDYAIVLYHGGKEQYRYPSPQLQKTCRKLIEKGADLVVCQHSHCIGCKEEYKKGTIVYGQGNFIFDHKNNEYWNTGLLICISDSLQIEYIPITKQGNVIRLASGSERESILSDFYSRSEEIKDYHFVEAKYVEFARKNNDFYMLYFSGQKTNLLFRIINKCSGYRLQKNVARNYKKHNYLGLRNYIECEAHRELLIEGLKKIVE